MMKINYSKILSAGFICGIAPIAIAQSDQKEHPNIVFILSDDHTSQSWGIYGGILEKYIQNTHIKRLADEGCVLNNCFCSNSISVPSRASILTGAYSHINGVFTLNDALTPESDNIAKRIRDQDYQTALFGKWHLKKRPAGFDRFCVFHDQGEYHNPIMKTPENWMDDDLGKQGDTIKGFSTDIVTDLSIDWIKNRNKEKPFMLFCHFKATHEPWDFPERFKHLYDDIVFPEPENLMEFNLEISGRTFQGQQLENLGKRWETASKNPSAWWCVYPELPFSTQGIGQTDARKIIYQKLIKDYLRCAAAIDDNIGRILKTLDREGLAENTIVIYVSDQGYFLGEHGFFDKRMMYEESLRMPFVIRYPKEIPAGSRNNDIILNTDFAALLADYSGAKTPDQSQGRSFRSNLQGKSETNWRAAMYYRYWTHEKIRPAHMGIRSQQYKLMFLYGDSLQSSTPDINTPTWEFYNLNEDPSENKNQYNNPEYKTIIRKMKKELLELRKETGDTDQGNESMQKIMNTYYW